MGHDRSMVRLTQTVQKGGCAAKVAASELRKILGELRFPPRHPELLIDGSHFDDAAIYKISDTQSMVQTIDFFTPILDTPIEFGRVAACNALSDVYAMGGRPVTAMAVLAFPLATMEPEVITQVLQGASDMITEAGACLVGGHSIDDDTLKFGLSVTGFVRTDRVWSNQGAQAGDRLILTKALGTGTMTAALKRGGSDERGIAEAVSSMTQLNRVDDLLTEQELSAIHAATDITGFGFSGHSYQMAKASGVRFRLDSKSLPSMDRAREFLEKEFLTKAHRTNREYTSSHLNDAALEPWQRLLIHDPQTSGGLLLSVEASQAERMVSALRSRFAKATLVGEVGAREEGKPFIEFV